MLLFMASLLLVPLLSVAVDLVAQLRVRRRGMATSLSSQRKTPNYTIIVPIYGDLRYLENVDYLAPYGARVLLATGPTESAHFYSGLERIARTHGFRTHIATHQPSAAEIRATGKRATGGTLRDIIVRGAHDAINSEYVVCIDADTRTELSLDLLVLQFVDGEFDLASVRLQVANRHNLLTRLQGHEYNMAMRLRTIMPWMVSGACHIGRANVHRTLMRRHSLFFQGNDVELGLLAQALGYRVGHIVFTVPTAVPSTVRAWWRQRRAWAGGEFRLMAVNIRLSVRHPFLYIYGLFIVIGTFPLRWYYVLHPTWSILTMLSLYYIAITVVNWRTKDRTLVVYPFYALIYSLILVPVGVISYVGMAIRYRNAGIIRPGLAPAHTTSLIPAMSRSDAI